MKLSNIITLIWLFLGIGLTFIDWRLTAVWVVSAGLSEFSDKRHRKESKLKNKKIPSYID